MTPKQQILNLVNQLSEQDITDLVFRLQILLRKKCDNCVYQVGCVKNSSNCNSYKRDPPDGGYYG